jgi:hypothetical protein
MVRLFRISSFLIVLCLTISHGTFSQTSTSRITGTVKDANGAVVPGATVTAKNESTGAVNTQTTTDSGLYAFPSLPVGAYTVTVEKQGFKRFQQTGSVLEVNTPLAVDIVMEIGQVTETVSVQGGSEQLQSSNATIGNVVERKAIETLPLNGRNPLTLIVLEPGVVQRSVNAAGSGIHVNGSRDRAFNVTIDGIEANESSVPNPVSNLYRINPDNVQEYKVTTNNATAEEGRNSGASVSIATRAGTNDFHGTAFYFLRNDALNSNEWFANAQRLPKPAIKLNQWGFEMGGPIVKGKTFFFGSYQGNLVNFTQPIDQSFGVPIVYTGLARQGIFRYFVPDPNNPLKINGATITRNSTLLVDPSTGNLISGVTTCATPTSVGCVRVYDIKGANNTKSLVLDSKVASILNAYPMPNNFAAGGDGLNTGAFLWNPPTQIKGPAIAIRGDHNFNDSNTMFARYLWSKYNTLKGDPLNARPQVFPGTAPLGEVYRTTSNFAVSYRRVFSPRVVNELTAGYARFNFLFTQGEANPAFPDVPPFDFFTISEPFNNTPRTARVVTTPQILDNLSITKGSHQFMTGFNMRFYRHVDQRGQPGGINVTPAISFNPTASSGRNPFIGGGTTDSGFTPANGINTSNDLLTLGGLVNNLYGLPSNISQTFISNLNDNVFLPFKTGDSVTLFAEKHVVNQYNLYFQDEWKVKPNLTLNYGARWEINPAPYTAGGNTYVPTTPIFAGPTTFVKADSWYKRDNLGAIGPRLGLAWGPDFKTGLLHAFFGGPDKSVVRVGYGIAFDPISSFQVTAAAGRVPGLLTTCSDSWPFTTTATGCQLPTNANSNITGGFGLTLGAPTSKPQAGLTPPVLLNKDAPPISVFAQDLKIPTVHEWSFSFQRELPFGLVGQAAYIGRRGERLLKAYNINQINSDPILPSFLLMQQNRKNGCKPDGTGCPAGVTGVTPPLLAVLGSTFLNTSTTTGELDINAAGSFASRIEDTTLALHLRPNQQFSTITYIDNGGDSNYHAAQFTLRRRFSSGLGLSLAYTFGKSIDNQSVDPVGASSGGGLSTTNSRTPTDIRNFREERARSDFDRTHVLTVASVWELPVGKGRYFLGNAHGVINQLLGGWTVNSIYTYMTGEPFSVRSGSRTANGAHESRAVVLNPTEAQLQYLPNVVGPVVFKDASNFALPAPGQNGAGRNIFVAPSYWNLDIGIIKTFPISERFKLQFRTEMFNALNHPNFDNPRDASVGSPSFRSSVFAQSCCATVAPPSTQTIIQTGESSRVIQFALKLQF